MLAALSRTLEITWKDTIISTGCYDKINQLLLPVDANTLPAKLECAKRFGYKKIILVEGQQDIPTDCPLETVLVNPDPNIAVFQLINPKLTGAIPKDRHVARLLYSADRLGKLKNETIIKTFLESDSKLVKSIASDILSRNALHRGETAEAAKYHKQVETLLWDKIPNGYLGHYLRYERIAATAILKIDLGIWNDEDETHTALDNRLAHLENAINGGFADRNDYFAALTLANTRVLRKRFQSRLTARCDEQFEQLLQSAWHDLIFLFDNWDAIYKFAERIDKKSTLRRQRNYCIECLTDYWKVHQGLPRWERVDEFLNWCKKKRYEDAFDKIAELNFRIIMDNHINEKELDTKIKRFDRQFSKTVVHPNWIFYEKILQFAPDTKHKQHCITKLTEVLPKLEENNKSIFILLALRTRAVLQRAGYKVQRNIPAPPADAPLQKIYDIIKDNPIDRCPY
ncbi:MAG: hypothetical protein LBT05_11250 [Planctomycetaceae bacterium]|nr:hypothetical protein [Planctomycetaceae bacterium]